MVKRIERWACALGGLVATLLLLLAVAPSAEASCAAPANEIEAENCQSGSPPSQWDISGAGSSNIQGFATDISVPQGGTVHFKVDTDASDYRLDIYRMGYYGGDGARLVTTVQPSAALPQNQPNCTEDGATGLIECGNWAESASWPVPDNAVSGIYFAHLQREDGTPGENHIVFVVRDDDGASDLLFQTSDTTWQAYNTYGGNSFYQGSPDNRAYKVSYDRPFITRGNAPEDWVFNAEYPMVRWLERNGYDVSYATGVDSDRAGAELREHKAFLSVGHDEYWSGAQRANVEAARDAGVNLAFFSGNEVFWKTRWEDSHRTLVTYKETHANAKIDPVANVWTGTWRDPRSFNPEGGRPENALTGTIFTVNAGSAGLRVPAEDGKLRLWRNSPVASQLPGAVATLADDTIGYEWDEDLDNGSRPAGLVRMSSTTVSGVDKLQDYGSTYASGTATHHLTLYRDTNGTLPDALVFGAGTVQWPWGLDSDHDRGGGAANASMQQATVNLLADMRSQPSSLQSGLAPASASSDTAAPTPVITAPAAGTSVEQGVPITVQGTAADAAGRVGAVEVSVDNGVSWHPATGREMWSYAWTPAAAGAVTIRARAADDSGNLSGPTAGVGITVGGRTCPCSLFGAMTPANAAENDNRPIEVGVRFRTDQAGTITALRYYKGAGWAAGTRVGHLWSATGTQLAEAQYTGESSSGWQQVALSQPVPVQANTTYVASFFSPGGSYAADVGFFTTDFDAAPLHAPAGGNGVYVYGGGFPTDTSSDTNYWADVVFAPADATPPAVTAVMPADGSVNVGAGTHVSATFSEPLNGGSVNAGTVRLRTAAGAAVRAAVGYDAAARTATLTPASPLASGASYSATVAGVEDLAGNVLATPRTWSFTVAPAAPDPDPEPEPGGEPNDQPPGGTPAGAGGGTLGTAGGPSGDAGAGRARVRGRRARVSRAGAFKLRVVCAGDERCRIKLRVRVAGRTAAVRTVAVPGGEKRRVRFRLRRRARRALVREGSLRATAIAVMRDAEGNRAATRTTIRLSVRHAPRAG